MATNNSSSNGTSFYNIINGNAGTATNSEGITTKAFALNLATGLALFAFEITAFLLLKSSDIGRRIYQPKTYLVQERLRVDRIPANPLKWLHRVLTIKSEELKIKCGLDGYFLIRFIRAMIVIFLPLMVIIVTILLPINYHGGKDNRIFVVSGQPHRYNVTGLDTLAWSNVAPTQTNRYWAHLLCALLAISWTLYRIYQEKLHFIDVRQQFLATPEHRLKASGRTVLIQNIPSEYQSTEALKALYDVFVDNDDRSRLHVWVNRDYGPLRALVLRRRKLRHALEKEELRILRLVNKQQHKDEDIEADGKHSPKPSTSSAAPDDATEVATKHAYGEVYSAFEADCRDNGALWHRYLKGSAETFVNIEDVNGVWTQASTFGSRSHRRRVPKAAWLRAEVARLSVEIEDMLQDLDNDNIFKRQNSAFIQFDRQMSAHMAFCLISHHRPGRMARFLDVAPHEILWPNMGLTSIRRFVRSCIALILFVGMIILWGVPTTFLGFLSQLESLRYTTSWLYWLDSWPSYLLIVPALCRKLAVLVGEPTRSKRELVTQSFYFTFLFIELVLVTSISSGIVATIPIIIENPTTIPTTLATDLPKAANYFFNYLIIQGLGFSGSVLFQYLRVLYITTIWPWFTQTPREEAFLQTTIPHQMWGNVYPLLTNFAVIGLIYSIIAPLMLVIISAAFILLWVAYRHNYYYVQRVKVDTHGLLFNNALSQLFAGIYVLEIALIGLFFLVRNTKDNVVCSPQAIIMIVALVLTAGFHYVMERSLSPLYELLPVTLEDSAADAERQLLLNSNDVQGANTAPANDTGATVESTDATRSSEQSIRTNIESSHLAKRSSGRSSGMEIDGTAASAANAREIQSRLKSKMAARLAKKELRAPVLADMSRRREVARQMGAAIALFPDELTDLSVEDRDAQLRVAYQDPITREPVPVIWVPQDSAGVSDDMIKQASKYGRYLQYSNAGALLTKSNKCEVTRPAPDSRQDWLLDWVL